MSHHIHFKESWRRIIPIIERSYGDALSQRSVDSESPPTLIACLSDWLQDLIHRGSAHCEEVAGHIYVQMQMHASFHCIDEGRDAAVNTRV